MGEKNLKVVVLDKLAKSSYHKYKNWKEQKDSLIFEDETWGEFVIEEIERAVVLALLVKQAEVLEIIEELRGVAETNVGYYANQDQFTKRKDGSEILVKELKKRLLAVK